MYHIFGYHHDLFGVCCCCHTDTACGPKEAFPTYCKSSCCEPLACTSCRLDVPGGGKSAEELAGLLFCSCCCCSEFDGSINRLLGDINNCKVNDQVSTNSVRMLSCCTVSLSDVAESYFTSFTQTPDLSRQGYVVYSCRVSERMYGTKCCSN